MGPSEALAEFLGKCLVFRKDRYVEFASRPKANRKFLDAIPHELEECFGQGCVVSELSSNEWASPAYIFEPIRTFGKEAASLEEAYSDLFDSVLVISRDGSCGFFRPEAHADSELLLRV